MSAALLMSNLQAVVKTVATDMALPREVCERVDRVISGNLLRRRFITFFYGLLDAEAGRFLYANAGHNPPILMHGDGSCFQLEEGGAAIGVLVGEGYAQGEVGLLSGDRVLLYTDGVTEAMDGGGELFGEERLVGLLAENRGLGAGALQNRVLEAITEFSQGDFQDDVTLMVLAVE